jgi:hypothetical protein
MAVIAKCGTSAIISYGEDGQIVPVEVSAKNFANRIKSAKEPYCRTIKGELE